MLLESRRRCVSRPIDMHRTSGSCASRLLFRLSDCIIVLRGMKSDEQRAAGDKKKCQQKMIVTRAAQSRGILAKEKEKEPGKVGHSMAAQQQRRQGSQGYRARNPSPHR